MECVYPEDLIKCQLPFFDPKATANAVPSSNTAKPRRTESGTSSESSSTSNDSQVTATAVHTSSSAMPQAKLSEIASLRVSKDSTGKPSYSTEVRLRMKSGEYRWHLVRVLLADPLIRAGTEEETWYGTCTDINVSLIMMCEWRNSVSGEETEFTKCITKFSDSHLIISISKSPDLRSSRCRNKS